MFLKEELFKSNFWKDQEIETPKVILKILHSCSKTFDNPLSIPIKIIQISIK